MSGKDQVEEFRKRLDSAGNYGEVWELVKDSVSYALNKRRSGMMLFLDDLPIQLGAYHPIGTNNIVLNRVLVTAVETSIESRRVINALIYNLLVHEYVHALGEMGELETRQQVVQIARKCFGGNHVVTEVAQKSPWSLLRNIPLETINPRKHVMEIVKDFEKTDKYIV